VTSFTVSLEIWWYVNPWRRIILYVLHTFEDLEIGGLVKFNGLQAVIQYRIGLAADDITNVKTVLFLSCLPYPDEKFTFMTIYYSHNS
jgi:hypothetical protein